MNSPSPHNCNTGFRKKRLWFKEIIMARENNNQIGGTHYAKCEIEPVEYIHANGLDFNEGSIVKYITRHRRKNGAEDIKKIKDFCDIILELDYGIKRDSPKTIKAEEVKVDDLVVSPYISKEELAKRGLTSREARDLAINSI